ncbi:acyl-[ACP]--phospholipid O-acyltransferase [bacterium]|nr:acyl-[ACP]--phospholipid O-acyltransferase [bacterium]
MNSNETNPEPVETVGSETGSLTSASFLGLVLTQFLGAFNDNCFRWLGVAIASQVMPAPKAIAIGTVCLTIPYLVLTPTAGWLADRFSKSKVITGFKIAEIFIMLFGLVSILYGNVWMLFATTTMLGIQSSLFGASKFGTIAEILPTRLLSKGNGLMAMTTIIAVGTGTICGFALYDFSNPILGAGDISNIAVIALVMLGIAISGTVASLFIQRIPAADPTRKPTINPVVAIVPALRTLFADPRLLKTSLGIAFFMFLASLSQQNIMPYAENVLDLNKTNVGILFGILIAGVGCGCVLAGIWSEGKVELGIVPIGGLGIIVSSIVIFISGNLLGTWSSFAYWGSCVGLFCLGASAGLYDVPLEAYLQFRSTRKNRGTVLAGSYFITYVFIVISAGLFVLMSSVMKLSPTSIFLVCGLMTIPVVGYVLYLLPDLTFRFAMWLLTHTVYRLRVFGRENIPETGPGLIVSNHISFIDGVLMMITSSRMIRFIIYADFTEMPLLRRLGKIMRVIPIDASRGPKELVRSLRTAKDAIKDGELVCIFAEGQLTRTGQMQPFQRGMMKIIQGTDAPIIPVYIHGLWGSIFSWRGGKLFWKRPRQIPYPVDIHIGKPLHGAKGPAEVRQVVEHIGAEAVKVDIERQPIPAQRFIRHCKANKSDLKVVDSAKTSLTGGKLLAGALAFRRVLEREVLSKDEKTIGLLVPPSVGGALANMAVALNGRVSVNLNYTLSEDVLNYCVKKAGIKHVLTSRKFLEKKPYNLEGAEFVFLEDLKEKITGKDKAMAALGAFAMPAKMLERVLGLHKIDPHETLTIVFTSGSTGEPKGVVLSHANVGSNIEAIDHLLSLNEKDAIIGVLPFFHSFGYTACMWLPMCYSVRGVYHFNPLDAKVVGRLCKENKATILMATPTFLKMYLRRCEKEELETLDLIVVGAEKLPTDLAKEFEAKFGVLPTEGYGTTELSPVAAVNIPDHRAQELVQQGTKLGTVGRPLPGVTAKIVNPDTREDLGIGTEGLLLIKGPNVMVGYLDQPDKTAEVIEDGWYNTGDIAVIDTEGFVSITGRQSRFSKIGGEMVPHIKIEQELTLICECGNDDEVELLLAVTSIPDDRKGERLIVLHRKLDKPVEEVLKELGTKGMPNIWLPNKSSFLEVECIPILGTGKLDLRGIKTVAEEHFCNTKTA